MYSKVIHIFSFLFSIMVYHRILNIVTSLCYKIGPCWLSILYNTVNFQMFKLVLEKAEEPETKLPTSTGSLKKQESSRKTSTSALLTMPKPLTVWITMNCGNSERDGNQTT